MNVVVSAIVDPWVTTLSFVVALAMRIQGSKIAVLLAILCVVFKCCIRQTHICNDKTTYKVSKTVSGLKILLVRRAREVLYDDQQTPHCPH